MKKSKKILMVAAGIVGITVLLGAGFFLRPKKAAEIKKEEPNDLELVGLAESEEAALELAQAYEIELISYNLGVAVFQTDKSYTEITAIGKEKGLAELSINYENKLFMEHRKE